MYPPSGPPSPQGFGPPQGAYPEQPYRGGGEFAYSDFDRSIIAELAGNVRFFGIVGMVCGGLGSLGGLFALLGGSAQLGQVINMAGLLAQGIFASTAAQRFKLVSETISGNIPNTLDALRALQRFYVAMIAVAIATTLTGLGTALFGGA